MRRSSGKQVKQCNAPTMSKYANASNNGNPISDNTQARQIQHPPINEDPDRNALLTSWNQTAQPGGYFVLDQSAIRADS